MKLCIYVISILLLFINCASKDHAMQSKSYLQKHEDFHISHNMSFLISPIFFVENDDKQYENTLLKNLNEWFVRGENNYSLICDLISNEIDKIGAKVNLVSETTNNNHSTFIKYNSDELKKILENLSLESDSDYFVVIIIEKWSFDPWYSKNPYKLKVLFYEPNDTQLKCEVYIDVICKSSFASKRWSLIKATSDLFKKIQTNHSSLLGDVDSAGHVRSAESMVGFKTVGR